jgi:arylsulfatase A-like enzyme
MQSAVLITIDTFRGDAFGAGGDPTVRSPALDRLFRQGTQFSEAYSASPATLPSHASILSGAWPTNHGIPRNMYHVPDELLTIAEVLSKNGFATAAFVSSVALDKKFNLGQGFDLYNFRPVNFVQNDQPWRPAPRTLHRAVNWWTSTPGRKFLWVHLFEPHMPYESPPPLGALYDTGYRGEVNGSVESILEIWADPSTLTEDARAYVSSLYLGQITALDFSLKRFLRELEEESGTAVVLTSDHGESLGEHNLYFHHGPSVFPTDVNVPLVVHGGTFQHSVSDAIVRLIDVPTTILSLLGMRAELAPESKNLAESIGKKGGLTSFSVATMPWKEAVEDGFANARMMRVARTSEVALVQTPWRNETFWFDRLTDPGEDHPLKSPPKSAPPGLERELTRWIEEAVPSTPMVADEHARQALQSLGYID